MANVDRFRGVLSTSIDKVNGILASNIDKINGVTLVTSVPLAAGTKAWFYANTAPTGWTVDGTPADCLLAVKGGSQAYNANGGTLQGSWTQPNCTLTTDHLPAHTHGEAGAHTHTYDWGYYYSEHSGYNGWYGTKVCTASTTNDTSSDGEHTHDSVGGGGAHNHGNTFRPYACLGIICTKDSGDDTDLPSGTKAWLYASSAPSGWTIDGTPSDRLLAVKGGTQAYNANGGTEAGTWTQPSHTLTTDEIPAHTHGESDAHTHNGNCANGAYAQDSNNGTCGSSPYNYQTTSSSGAHTHDSVGSGGGHSHGTSYRPLARVGIICTKDDNGNFSSGEKAFFYQNAAPTNWTAQAYTDGLLAVKGGSVYTTGGSEQGTWTQPDHTLTTAEIPAHTHGEAGAHTHDGPTASGLHRTQAFNGRYYCRSYNKYEDEVSGSSGAHTHDSVGGGDAHNHGNTYRPYAAVGLIAAKD